MIDRSKWVQQWSEADLHFQPEKGPPSIEGFKKDFMKEVLQDQFAGLENQINIQKISSLWPKIAGPVAKFSEPLKIDGDRLIVSVEKPVYAQELNLYQRQIMKKLNEVLECPVRKISIRIS